MLMKQSNHSGPPKREQPQALLYLRQSRKTGSVIAIGKADENSSMRVHLTRVRDLIQSIEGLHQFGTNASCLVRCCFRDSKPERIDARGHGGKGTNIAFAAEFWMVAHKEGACPIAYQAQRSRAFRSKMFRTFLPQNVFKGIKKQFFSPF